MPSLLRLPRDPLLRPALLLSALTLATACAAGEEEPPQDFPDGSLFSPDARVGPGEVDGGGADASFCPTDPCDLHEQCGCGDEEACDVDLDNLGETRCRAVNEFGGHADTCELDDVSNRTACRPGFTCIGGEPSFCRKYCQSDDDCPGAGGICIIELTSGGEPTREDAVMCTFHCDATRIEPPNCPEGRGCYIASGNDSAPQSNRHTRCLEPGDLGHEEGPCETNSDCQAGHGCVLFDGEGECRRTCIIGESGPCGGFECTPYSESDPQVGEDEYGFCDDSS